jgi:predicted  nucleic acid-binding Zn-ribbon protein
MHPAIAKLIEVQRVDLRIAALRAALDAFPARLRAADAKLSGAQKELAAAREAHTASLTERKKFELDAQQWKDRAKKYRDQSGQVKTNEAYKALQHEIANAEAEASKAEDRVLEFMMSSEAVDRRVKDAEAALKEAEKVVAADRQEIESERAVNKKELEEATAERDAALAPVPEDIRDVYLRVAKRHHGVALAEARGEQCLGCGMRVLPHIHQDLCRSSSETIYQCETCNRILFVNQAAAAPPAAGAAESSPADSSS